MTDPLSSGSPAAAVRRLGRAAHGCHALFGPGAQTAVGPPPVLLPNTR